MVWELTPAFVVPTALPSAVVLRYLTAKMQNGILILPYYTETIAAIRKEGSDFL
jgi:hypothetical protein